MIDRVRTVVLALLKKENKGWLKPDDFNRFSDLTQLEIFEDYFTDYNRWLKQADRRGVHEGYADIPSQIAEKIDRFLVTDDMSYSDGLFSPPADCYKLQTVLYNGATEIEQVRDKKMFLLNSSEGIAPSTGYPAFMRIGQKLKVYPTTITSNVSCYYLRRPKTPNWTYLIQANNPVFDESNTDYQDFEIHPSDEYKLVAGILSKAGVSIGIPEIVDYIEKEQATDTQLKNS